MIWNIYDMIKKIEIMMMILPTYLNYPLMECVSSLNETGKRRRVLWIDDQYVSLKIDSDIGIRKGTIWITAKTNKVLTVKGQKAVTLRQHRPRNGSQFPDGLDTIHYENQLQG